MLSNLNKSQYEIAVQFKKDFGITLEEAEKIAQQRKSASDERFYLGCLLGGLDIKTSESVCLSEEEKQAINERLNNI